MNRLNLDISQYSTPELEEIFNVNCSVGPEKINSHFDDLKTTVIVDNNLSLDEKDNITAFLNKVVNKLSNSLDKLNVTGTDNTVGTYSASSNPLVKNSAHNHPLIADANAAAGLKANIHEGKTWSGDYPPGHINPINIKTITKVLNIDSRFRSSYYSTMSTNFHIDLPETFNRVVSMRLTTLEIPLSIYGINSTNNCFTVDSSNIDLSYGNYRTPFNSVVYVDPSANLRQHIQDQLNATGLDISYNVDPISGKSIFTNHDPSSHTIYFNKDCHVADDFNTPLPLKLGWLLGFRAGVYHLESGASIVSEGIPQIASPKYIYFCINDYTNAGINNFVAAFSQSTLSPNIMTRVLYQDLLQSKGIYNLSQEDDVPNAIRDYFGPVDIQKLHVQFLDEYGRVVDFNNMDWSCSLTFDILYD
jgi:hypothetical protein